MSLRTRRGWALLASAMFVAAACGGTPAQSPGGGTSPAATTASQPASPSTAASVGTGASPSGDAGASPSGDAGASPSGDAGASPSGDAGASPSEPAASPSVAQSVDLSAEPDLFGTTYREERFTEGQQGGQVIVADWQEANLFNPYYFNQVTEADVNTAAFMALLTSTDDFKYSPDAAAEIPTTENGGVKVPGDNGDAMTVTWKLREGLKWSDGEAHDCEDYKFTLGWIMDEANTGLPAGKTGYEDITAIDCPSPTDMVWHFENIYEAYLTLFGTGALPQHYMADIPIAEALTGKGWLADELPNAPVSGPFKFESVTPGQELRMARNENYVDRITGQPAYLDGLVFKWYADAATMIAGFQGAEPQYDLAKDLNDADLPSVQGLNEVIQKTSLTYEFLRPNWDPENCGKLLAAQRGEGCPMSDVAMRQALRLAVDKEEINQRLLGGNAALGLTNVSPNAWFYVPAEGSTTADAEAATAALTEGGWADANEDGILEKGDLQARLELCTTTRQVRQDTLALVAGYLNGLGIQSIIQPVSPSDIFASFNESTENTPCALSRGNFDVALHAFSVPLDPFSNYPVYHSSQVPPEGGNDARVSSPEIDKALDTVKNTVDFKEVRQAMADFQQLYQEQAVEVPLYFRQEVYLKRPALQNFTGNPTSTGPLWNVAHWWLQEQ